jgi:hypothetical protein
LLRRLNELNETPHMPISLNRARYIGELNRKLESRQLSEPERVAQATAEMERHRQEARETLVNGPPEAPRPVAGGLHKLLANKAALEAERAQANAEARAWRTQARAREARRQRMAAAAVNADGGEIGAHERALRKIARLG